MSGKKIHFFILLIVLLSVGLGDCNPRLGRRNRKRQGLLGAVVGSALAVGVKKMIKIKTTPRQPFRNVAPAAEAIQPIHTAQLGYGPNDQFNNISFPIHPQSNQTNWGTPAYPPNSIFPVASAIPVQPETPQIQNNPAPGSAVQMPSQPITVATNLTSPPTSNGRNSASTINFNHCYLGFGALGAYMMISCRSRF